MSSLEEMTAALRGLDELGRRTAAIAAPLLEEKLKATAAAGVSPEGKPWAPRKDGGRPMAHAAARVSVRSFGTVVRVVLEGPEVWHHFGARGATRRPVIPDGGGPVPGIVNAVLEQASDRAFAALTGGR